MRATWYNLEGGKLADPNECSPDEAGRLMHKSGVPVAMRGQVPSSSGVDLDDAGNLLFGGKGDHDGNGKVGGSATADMQPEPKPEAQARPRYKTRRVR